MHCTRARLVPSLLAAAVIAALFPACATQTYYLRKPDTTDDTLLVIRAYTVSDPAVEYRLVLESGERIRVSPQYPLTFVQGLAPGIHRAVRVLAGQPGGSRFTGATDIDVEFRMERGAITVFPAAFAVQKQRYRRRRYLVVETQRCTFPALDDSDLPDIRRLFEKRFNSGSWDDFPVLPVGSSRIPESVFLLWRDSYISRP